MSFTQRWLITLLHGLQSEPLPETRERLLDACGRACGLHNAEQVLHLVARASDLSDAVSILNRAGKGGGHLDLDGNAIRGQYDRCYCPMWKGYTPVEGDRSAGGHCRCSEGYLHAMFEPVFGRPVEVIFEQTVLRGDPVCRFVVR
jgi:predicted hydrocarbon binding protein